VPIPGTKSRTRLEENLAAVDVQLTEAELAELELPVSGERYPEGMMRLIAQG
jgi:Predicted oxidoreductases (related to aryl-alcohol dehydrogenases)